MTTTITAIHHVIRDGEEVAVEAQVLVTAGVRGVHTQRNGDPGWPDSPPEFEIVSAVNADTGAAIELTQAEWDSLLEDMPEPDAPDEPDDEPFDDLDEWGGEAGGE